MSTHTHSMYLSVVKARCQSCHAYLASDNPGPLCSPCSRRDLLATISPVSTFGTDREDLMAAFDAGGLSGLAARLDCGLVDAFEVALANGLVPVAYRRRTIVVRQLLDRSRLSHIAVAEQLGLSRWTVATYRKELRLQPVRLARAAA